MGDKESAMTKAPVKVHQDPEIRPDGWERFEKAVDEAVKGGPKRGEFLKEVKNAEPKRRPTGRSRKLAPS